jgi:hypothetical protein
MPIAVATNPIARKLVERRWASGRDAFARLSSISASPSSGTAGAAEVAADTSKRSATPFARLTWSGDNPSFE